MSAKFNYIVNIGRRIEVREALKAKNQRRDQHVCLCTGYQRAHDSFGRLVSYPLGNPAGTGVSAGVVRTLSYDHASRITGYSHTGAASLDQSFAYDGLDRLTDAIQGGTLHG